MKTPGPYLIKEVTVQHQQVLIVIYVGNMERALLPRQSEDVSGQCVCGGGWWHRSHAKANICFSKYLKVGLLQCWMQDRRKWLHPVLWLVAQAGTLSILITQVSKTGWMEVPTNTKIKMIPELLPGQGPKRESNNLAGDMHCTPLLEAEAGGPWIQVQPGLHSELQAGRGYQARGIKGKY